MCKGMKNWNQTQVSHFVAETKTNQIKKDENKAISKMLNKFYHRDKVGPILATSVSYCCRFMHMVCKNTHYTYSLP